MFSDLRRVVTGHNKDGESCITFDGSPPESYSMGAGGLYELWDTDRKNPLKEEKKDRGKGKVILGPENGGAKFRYFSIAPFPEGVSNEEMEQMFAKVFDDISASADRVDTTKHPGMHKTKTLDYIILLKGNAKLILDAEETELKPFDVVVQRGTNHAWVCTGEEPALFIAVLIDSEVK
jgi:hypothetical protein